MTADAKVGLLLGLVFIVIIAFLVNGLPNFLQTADAKDAVEVAITTETGPDLVIDRSVVETARSLDRTIPLRQTEPPEEVIVIQDAEESAPVAHQRDLEIPSYTMPERTSEPVRETVRPAPITRTKVHVVKSGENLAVIAQKYYGSEEGNRRAVINKLFEANTDILEAPDKIRVGDKIKVPALEQLFASKQKPVRSASNEGASESLLNKFSNLFERSDKSEKRKSKHTRYVVQEGETLWSIAQEQLGNGNRYKEIAKLNKMKNEDKVVAGKVLELPR